MSAPSCDIHGTAHVTRDPQRVGYRCAAATGDGTTCGRIALPSPPRVPPPRLPWHIRIYDRLPERATVECIMCTLVIGFWISALIWVRILF